MIDRIKLLDTILDNQESTDIELILKIENVISNGISFNHSNTDVKQACGIDRRKPDFKSRNKDFTKISEEVEHLEKVLTKREITFMTVMMSKKGPESESLVELLKIFKKFKDR